MGFSNFGIPDFLLLGQILHDQADLCAHYDSLVAKTCPEKTTPSTKNNRDGSRTVVSTAGKKTPRVRPSKLASASKVLFPIAEEALEEVIPAETPSANSPETVSEPAKDVNHA